MGWTEERAVGIYARGDKGDVPLGAGALVTKDTILTALGVVRDHPQPLVVRTRRGDERSAKLLPWRLDGVDVALVRLSSALDVRLAHPLLLLADRALDGDTPWEADGHRVSMHGELADPWRKVGGRTRSYARGGERVELDVTTKVDVGDGLPGAAVVVDCQVVGIIGSAVMDSTGGAFLATPTGRFLREKTFREALGISLADEESARRTEATVTKVQALLAEHANLRTVLAKQLDLVGSEASYIAPELVRRKRACEVAAAIEKTDLELEEKGDPPARRALRAILLRVLPYATDWERVVSACTDALRSNEQAFEVPIATETAAEVIFAGVDDRPCLFEENTEDYPIGVSLLRVPGAIEEYLHHPEGNRASEILVEEIAQRFAIPARFRRTHRDRCAAVEAELRRRASVASYGREPPLYVLVEDPTGDGARSGALWGVLLATAGRDVRTLRFVRLTGGDFVDELTMAAHVREILKRMK